MVELLTLEGEITTRPDNEELIERFTEKSVDSATGTVRTAGYGRPPQKAESTVLAREAAKQAAYLDACRWVLYARAWRQNPKSARFGSIEGQLKGAKIVHSRISANSEVTVLVEAPIQER